jgi:uncharacterized protein YjcR
MTVPIPFDVRRRARQLYWAGYDCEQIAELTGANANTVRSWKQRDAWDTTAPLERIESALDARLQLLIIKEDKNGRDFKEIDLLGRQLERSARVRRFEAPGGHEGDLNEKVANRNSAPKKKPKVNFLTTEQIDALRDDFFEHLFDFQLTWWEARLGNKTRFILKSRQIGATWYFAREAFMDALETGSNQIFLSASRNQANIFRTYIVEWVYAVTGVQLKGEHLTIDRGQDEDGKQLEQPTIYFLGTNYRTAQGYHGNFYFDECFWVHGFEQIEAVASGMATQKRYRETYFSTPSSITHEAYDKWTGKTWLDSRPKSERTKIEVSHAALKAGMLGPDEIWRQIVTIEDAEAAGSTLFDIAHLRRTKPADVFDNLYMCNFVDDTVSMFPFAMMRRSMVDAFDAWRDFNSYLPRPFADGEVWIGYDPQESANGDQAACVVVAPPSGPKGKFRVLEKFQWRGKDFTEQAEEIRKLCQRYNVQHIGIDTTGAGAAVWQCVVKFFPRAQRIDYSLQVKSAMVYKAKHVFTAGRIEFDAHWADVAASFMAIRPQITKSGRQITYVAQRSEAIGHADLAWAIMHALYHEPMDADDGRPRKSRLRIIQNGEQQRPASGRRRRRGHDSAEGLRHAHVQLRRSRAGARSARPVRHARMRAQLPLVRTAGADGRPRTRLPDRAAS